MIAKIVCLQGVLIGLLCSNLALADSALSHDPFSRPSLVAAVQGNAVGATAVEEMPGNPKLTAVMLAGKHSLATVDGVVMKLGDERDGYLLVKVRDHKAIFRQGKKRVVLKMETPSIKLSQ